MSTVSELHKKWSKNPKYAKAFAELAPEYAVARAVIEARVLAGLTQEELAQRMETSQSAIARLESGRGRPSTAKRLAVHFVGVSIGSGASTRKVTEPVAPLGAIFIVGSNSRATARLNPSLSILRPLPSSIRSFQVSVISMRPV
jgi:transcriptional regulator with XRE-family HTH domain